MAIKTIDDTNLTAIANAIREKGVTGTFKPSEMAPAIQSIPTGGGTVNLYDMITDTEHYGITIFSAGSTVSNMTLPDGVNFDDIVFLAGVGGLTSTSSARTTSGTRLLPYLYYPMMYDHKISGSTLVDGGILHLCNGFVEGHYSNIYELGVLLGGPDFVGSWYNTGQFTGIGPYGRNVRFIILRDDLRVETSYYALAKYGSAVMLYRK